MKAILKARSDFGEVILPQTLIDLLDLIDAIRPVDDLATGR